MSALNSLSAQYTDSEGEDDSHNNSGSRAERRLSGAAATAEKPKSPELADDRSNSNIDRPTRLVSYLGDDGEVDDDSDLEDAGSLDMDISHSDEDLVNTSLDAARPANGEPADGGIIPSEPPGNCSRELQETVARLVETQQRTRTDMNERFKNKKDFRNPSIYEKLINFCGIDEFGTNYPPELYDPSIWGKQSFYEELARVQKEDMERREKERKERTKVEVVTATKKLDGSEPKRRSKWDVVATGGSLPPPSANLTTSKSIPAFGGINKRK